MTDIHAIIVSNGLDYEDHRSWPMAYTDDPVKAATFIKQVNGRLSDLYADADKAQARHNDRVVRASDSSGIAEDLDFKDLYETAAGKRLRRYMEGVGILSRGEKYHSRSLHSVTVVKLPEINADSTGMPLENP